MKLLLFVHVSLTSRLDAFRLSHHGVHGCSARAGRCWVYEAWHVGSHPRTGTQPAETLLGTPTTHHRGYLQPVVSVCARGGAGDGQGSGDLPSPKQQLGRNSETFAALSASRRLIQTFPWKTESRGQKNTWKGARIWASGRCGRPWRHICRWRWTLHWNDEGDGGSDEVRQRHLCSSPPVQVQERFGWDALKKAFGAYHSMSSYPDDNSSKMNLYAETVSQAVGMDLTGFFKSWGWPIQGSTEENVRTLPPWTDHPMAQYDWRTEIILDDGQTEVKPWLLEYSVQSSI